jgi:Flp pilus assembly protein TadD
MPPSALDTSKRDRRWPLPLPIAAGFAALLAGSLYLNALQNPFVHDDYRSIVENTSILNVRDLPGIAYQAMTRPLVNLSYAMDAAIWGRQPFGFHLTSVLLHMLNAGLVLYVAWFVAGDRRRQRGQLLPATASPIVVATATAVLFAAHPLMTQAVGYISGRSEVLYTACFLAAFLSARRWMVRGGGRWWWAAMGLWALSLMAKETAAMLGVVLLLYDRLVLEGDAAERSRRLWRLHIPLLSMAALAGVIRLIVLIGVEYPGQQPADWRFALVAVDVVRRYLLLLAFPRGQSIFHDVPVILEPLSGAAIAAVAGLAGFLTVAWWLRRVQSTVAFGCLWFVLMLVPSGVLFALGRGEPMAEHRVYGASIGIFLAIGSAFGMLSHRLGGRGPGRRWLLHGLAVLFVVQLGGRTIVRNSVWGDPIRLSREAVELSPGHWLPRLLLGEALRTAGRCDQAIDEYRVAIDLRPQEAFAYTKLAGCLIGSGRLTEAAEAFAQLGAVDPESPHASTGLGVVAILEDRVREGRAHFSNALEKNPSDSLVRQLLALTNGTLDPERTAALCGELARLAPATVPTEACAVSTGSGPRPQDR